MATLETNSDKRSSYFGGKSGNGTYQTIINQIPPHQMRISMFGGMLGVESRLNKCDTEIVFDLIEDLLDFYFESGFDSPSLPEGPHTDFNRTFYHCDSIETLNDSEFCYLIAVDEPHTFIYADPPYPLESRKSQRKVYKHEMNDFQHKRLLKCLTKFKNANIAISTYPNEIYDAFFSVDHRRKWRMIEFESTTRHGKATEQLWMNYPPPTELHDYRYLGDDFRERERITRQKRRLLRKVEKLAPLEQKALVQAMQESLRKLP